MAINDASAKYKQLLNQIGKAALHSAFPDDFEYYACAFELTDSEDQLIDSLVFPVMPSSITMTSNNLNNQKKTATGVVSLYETSFVPIDLTISGDFGRKMRLFTSSGEIIYAALKNFTKRQTGEYKPKAFSATVKTGYGVTKALEKILNDSHSVDDNGKPVRLYFYNLSLNSNYLVECKNFRFDQNQQTNMIWNYSVTLKALAPAYSIRQGDKNSITNLLTSSVVNRGFELLTTDLKDFKKKRLNLTK